LLRRFFDQWVEEFQSVERGLGIDPDEHAIKRGKPCAHGVADIVLVDHRFGIDADFGKRRRDGFEPARLRSGAAARRFIAPPQDGDAAEASCGLGHGKTAPLYSSCSRRAHIAHGRQILPYVSG
jgi:hypothetical protein